MNPMYWLRWVWVLWVAWVGTLEAQEPGLPGGSVRWHWKVPEVSSAVTSRPSPLGPSGTRTGLCGYGGSTPGEVES
jgi:hypothetical protein